MKLNDPRHVRDLPQGTLWVDTPQGRVRATFSSSEVFGAARVITGNRDGTDFGSQAQVIKRAGWHYNWGFGQRYEAT